MFTECTICDVTVRDPDDHKNRSLTAPLLARSAQKGALSPALGKISLADFQCDRSIATCIQRDPALFIRSSVHLVGGRPTLRLPVRGRHSRIFLPHRPSSLRAMWPW
ncbi:uncharacterized protein LOC119629498 [Bombyx mori]|uniref:uncharacterized protein LOC119629498 n=1 Tax=Bombyx mori TaxID=7091 RepID=UPI0003500303